MAYIKYFDFQSLFSQNAITHSVTVIDTQTIFTFARFQSIPSLRTGTLFLKVSDGKVSQILQYKWQFP